MISANRGRCLDVAYERYLVQVALRQAAGTDFGLDTDASWPQLQQCADKVSAWLEEQR